MTDTATLDKRIEDLRREMERPVIEQAIAQKAGDQEAFHRHDARIRELVAAINAANAQRRTIVQDARAREEWSVIKPRAEAANRHMIAARKALLEAAWALVDAVDGYVEATRESRAVENPVDRLTQQLGERFRLERYELENVLMGDRDSSVPAVLLAIAGAYNADGYRATALSRWPQMRAKLKRGANGAAK